MANHLKMADVQAIYALRARGWSQRRIARELKIDRETVRRHLRLMGEPAVSGRVQAQNQPQVITGSAGPPGQLAWVPDGSTAPNPAKVITDSEQARAADPAQVITGSAQASVAGSAQVITGELLTRSRCEPFRQIILDKLEQGLSARRIWQDLDPQDSGLGYQSVQRFIRTLGRINPLPFRRMECEPGEQAQVDFGTGAPVIIPAGEPLPIGVKTRRRNTHVFRIVLSHSRKAYSEAVYHQTTEQFIRALENAFWHFGGVPKTLVIDNLKAAVTQADWYDPELNPKIQSFCRHYGTVILPTKPRTPRHKGKVEREISYVKGNGLKGHTFTSLAEENLHLQTWERTVADTRIHGTTQKQVKKCFEEVERPALLPLPTNRFPCFEEGKRTVNRDGHVEVAKAYYSVPPEYLGRSVWVRWDSHTVRIFNHQFQQVEMHPRQEPGQFSKTNRNIPEQKRSGIERGAAYNLNKASLIGHQTGRWAEQMISQRGIEGIRVLLVLLSLSKHHPADAIERACETAASHGAYRLRTVRELIKRQGDRQEQFEFIEEHPIIRSLSDYGDLVYAALYEEKWNE